jgi:hypothetical protein
MKANELRIGNLIYGIYENIEDEADDTGNQIKEVVEFIGYDPWQNFFWVEGSINTEFYESFEPIPLTEEWLVKFGFEKLWYDDNGMKLPYYRLNKNDYVFDLDYEFCATRDDAGYIYLKSVHQLQNLYFALTGEELELK